MLQGVVSDKLAGVLREFRARLEELYGDRLVDVLLFGSRARGDAEPDSDVDVAVILKGPVRVGQEIRRVSEARAEMCLEHGLDLNCMYLAEDRLREWTDSFTRNVRKDGIRI